MREGEGGREREGRREREGGRGRGDGLKQLIMESSGSNSLYLILLLSALLLEFCNLTIKFGFLQ